MPHQQLIEFLQDKFHEVRSEDAEKISRYFQWKEVPKNELLLAKDQVSKHLFFVKKGILRTFYITKYGNESTRIIALEQNFCGSLASFIQQKPSFEYIEALEDSEVLQISYTDFQDLIQISIYMEKIYRKLLEEVQIFNMWRIESFISMNAKERYLHLLDQRPDIAASVSNKILASYLAIKPETLSRLKSNL